MTNHTMALSLDATITTLQAFWRSILQRMPKDQGAKNNAIREARNLRKLADQMEAFYCGEDN